MKSERGALLTVTEVADEWRVSKMTVYRLIHQGTLGAIWIGRSIRLREADVRSVELARARASGDDDLNTNGE